MLDLLVTEEITVVWSTEKLSNETKIETVLSTFFYLQFY